MPYVPFYYDGDVQTGLFAFCVLAGVVAVILGRRASLPAPRLKRRAIIAAGCAIGFTLLYSLYILQRQSVETAHHMTFGDPQKISASR